MLSDPLQAGDGPVDAPRVRTTVAVGGRVRGPGAGTALLRALTRIAETRPEPLQPLLDAVVDHLAATTGPGCGAVVLVAAGPAAVPAAAAGSTAGDAVEEPLRHAGVLVGVLRLHGGARLPAPVAAAVRHHLAAALRERCVQEQLRRSALVSSRLFELASRAVDLAAAALAVAEVAAEALSASTAAIYLVGPGTVMTHALGVRLPAEQQERLARTMLGRRAADSPAWARLQAAYDPDVVEDATTMPVRPGGFVQTLGLRSFVSVPLRAADGLVGAAVCGETQRHRTWTAVDREVARRLAEQAPVVIENARLREAEREHAREMEHRAFHDALTGLPNRSALLRALGEALDGPGAVALLLVDLDGFKQVNDTLGHHAGDELLRLAAQRLRDAAPPGATPARLGGDELALVLPGAGAGEALAVARALHGRLGEPYDVDGASVLTGASVGVATAPGRARDVTGLLRAADEAMYRAKRERTGPRAAGT